MRIYLRCYKLSQTVTRCYILRCGAAFGRPRFSCRGTCVHLSPLLISSWGFAVASPSAQAWGGRWTSGARYSGRDERPRATPSRFTRPSALSSPYRSTSSWARGSPRFRALTLQVCPDQMPPASRVQHPAWCRVQTRLTPPSNHAAHQAMDLASQFYVQLQMIARPTPQVNSRALRQPGRLVLRTSSVLRAPMSHSGLSLFQAAPPFRPGIGLPEHGEALTASSYLIPPLPQILNATLKYFN